jgi:glycosyltransferase involved in cell wall biosynthesis
LRVIIPTYKGSKYIAEAVKSIPEGVDVIVGVDGCVEDYSHIENVIKYPHNVGTYCTLNKLLLTIEEGAILIMGADDYWLQFPTEIPKANEIHRYGYDGVICALKSTFDKLGGFNTDRVGMDSDLLLRAAKLGVKITEMGGDGYYRRVHPESLTQAKKTGYGSQYRENIRQQMFNRIKNNNLVANYRTMATKFRFKKEYEDTKIIWKGAIIHKDNLTDRVGAEIILHPNFGQNLEVVEDPNEKKKESVNGSLTESIASPSKEEKKDLPTLNEVPKPKMSRSRKSKA